MSDFNLTGDQYGRLVQVVDGYFFDGFGNPLDLSGNGGSGPITGGGTGSFMLMEISVSGAQNNSNKSFTLSPAIDVSGTNLFFINGQLMTSVVDYTITSSTSIVISQFNNPPYPDDVLRFFTSVMVVNTNGITVNENGVTKVTGATTLNMVGATVTNPSAGVATITVTGGGGGSGSSGSSGTSGAAGAPGPAGSPGVPGAQGPYGPAGASGTSGTSGTTGPQGDAGPAGPAGGAGVNGTSGTSGTNGVQGLSGTSGSSGTSGTTGPQGPSGVDGTNGTAGSSGTSGTTGPQGPSGVSLHNSLSDLQGGKPTEYYHLDSSQLSRVLNLIYINSVMSHRVSTPSSGYAERGISTNVRVIYNIKSNDDVVTSIKVDGVAQSTSTADGLNHEIDLGNKVSGISSILLVGYTRNGIPQSNASYTATYNAYVAQYYGLSKTADFSTYVAINAAGFSKSIQSGYILSNSNINPVDDYVWFISNKSNAVIKDINNFSPIIGSWNDNAAFFWTKTVSLTLPDGSSTNVYYYRSKDTLTLTNYLYTLS